MQIIQKEIIRDKQSPKTVNRDQLIRAILTYYQGGKAELQETQQKEVKGKPK